MYVTFLESKARFNLIKESEYGLLYTKDSGTIEPVRGTGHTRLEFGIHSKKRAKKDGGGTKSVDIYFANAYSRLILNNSVTDLLLCSFRERLYDFRPVPKDVLSRAILSKLPLNEIWGSFKIKNFYKPVFEYKDEFIDLEGIEYDTSERSRYELLSIDLFIDKDENWSISPSSATKYKISTSIDGKKYKRLITYPGDDMKHLESIDFSNDTYFGQYYNIILNYFDLIKT